MAAAAGKKRTTSLSLFMEAFGLEVEEEHSTIATQTWLKGHGQGKLQSEQKEAWMRQIFEVLSWKQVKGPTGAVFCETRDLGVNWPQWHTLTFERQVRVDMRGRLSEGCEEMLLGQARSTYRRKWGAKH